MVASSRVSAEASSDPAARAWAMEVVRTSAEESAIVRRSLCSSIVGAARKELEMGPACSSSTGGGGMRQCMVGHPDYDAATRRHRGRLLDVEVLHHHRPLHALHHDLARVAFLNGDGMGVLAVNGGWNGQRIDCDWRIPAADGGAADCGLREQMQQVWIVLKKQVPGAAAAAAGLPPITDFRHRAAIWLAQIDGHGRGKQSGVEIDDSQQCGRWCSRAGGWRRTSPPWRSCTVGRHTVPPCSSCAGGLWCR